MIDAWVEELKRGSFSYLLLVIEALRLGWHMHGWRWHHGWILRLLMELSHLRRLIGWEVVYHRGNVVICRHLHYRSHAHHVHWLLIHHQWGWHPTWVVLRYRGILNRRPFFG